MNESCQDGLHSLLFKEGRELSNIKFFPGTRKGLTAEQMRAAAEKGIRSAMKNGLVNQPPKSGVNKTTLEGFLSQS